MRAGALIVFLALLVPQTALSQVLIRGKVTEAGTGQVLPAATVQVEGRTVGTVTNADGSFSLALRSLPAVLLVRHIGYRSARIELDQAPGRVLEIELEPDPVVLEGVVVTGEDPAVALMRQVLARKRAWTDTVSTAYAEVYSRFMLYREFDLVQVEETIGASWWRADRGSRQVTRARRTRPDRNEQFLYASMLPVANLYDDEIVFEGTRYRGALHPDALRFYRFRLTGRRAQDGQIIHDVAFSPTNLTLAGFIGTLAVEDSTFDVLSMTARPVVDRIGPPPILERTVRLEQRYTRRGGAVVPVFFRADGWVRFGRAGVSYPRARFSQVSGLSLHATRVLVPDSLFESGRPIRDDPAVATGTWLFDWNPGMIPFSEDESRDLTTLRSDRRLGQYFRPEGLLAQYAAVPISAPRVQGFAPPPERRTRWLVPWVWYNRVDGWHVGIQPEVPFGRGWTLRPGLAYDEAPDRLSWFARTDWDVGGRTRLEAGAERYTAVTGIGTRQDRFLTGLAAYAGYDDYFDYFDRARRWSRIGVDLGPTRWGLTLAHEEHTSLQKRDDFEGWLRKNVQRDNPPVEEGTLSSAELRFTAGDLELRRAGLEGHLDIRAELAPAGVLGSDFDFARWQGTASVRIPTLMKRRAVPASLRLDVVAGGGTEGVPIQRQGILDVATGPVARAVAFRSRRDARLTARNWLAVFWEHDFGSAIGERLRLGETSVGLLVFGAHGTAWHGETFRRDEVGIAWSKPFNLPLRINLATELREFKPLVTVEYYGLARRLLRR